MPPSTSLPADPTSTDPIELFGSWYAAAETAGIAMPEAVALATATSDGVPSVRMVLLKGADADGFVFFTNYESRKAGELEENPVAALCFHWTALERQVRVSGTVTRTSREESAAYFATRGRGSRIGAWASRQSRPGADRSELIQRAQEIERRFEGREVPLPDHWGGYRIAPTTIEFWQGRPDRLHDRLVFSRTPDGWSTQRLDP